MVLTSEKLSFTRNLRGDPRFPKEDFLLPDKLEQMRMQVTKNLEERIAKKIKDKQYPEDVKGKFDKEDFYTPIQYYTCNNYYATINRFMSKLKVSELETQQDAK